MAKPKRHRDVLERVLESIVGTAFHRSLKIKDVW